jgi:hypothetical protein
MLIILRHTIASAATLLLVSCATNVNLTSSPPGVDVFLGTEKLGTTPIFLREQDLGQVTAGGHYLRLINDGYKPVHIWFPTNTRGLEFNVNMLPFKREDKNTVSELFQGRLTSLARKYLEAQTSLLKGGSEGAAKAEGLVNEFPQYASSHFLQSIAAIRANDNKKAFESISSAVRINPSDPSYATLYSAIDGKENVDANATGGEDEESQEAGL